MNFHTFKILFAPLGLVLAMVGCGGHEQQSETPAALATAEYLGTWYPINPSCQSNFYYNPSLYVGGAQLQVTAETLSTTVTAYSDSNCTRAVGTLTRTYLLTTALGNVTGKDNVAKWYISLPNNAYTTNIPTLTKVPGILTEPAFSDLADVQNGLLYRGDQTSAKDSQGFPSLLQSAASYTRTAPNNGNDNDSPDVVPTDPTVKINSISVNGVSVDPTRVITVQNGDAIRITTDKVTTFGVGSFKNGASIETTVQYLDTTKGVNSNTWYAAVYSTPGSTLRLSYLNTNTNALIPFTTLTINVESAYQGLWNASYTGGDSGNCSSLSVNALGELSGTCSSTSLSTAVTVSGSVNAQGSANFSSGTASTGATFSGTFEVKNAVGTWTNKLYGIQGTWTASKR